MCPAVSNGADAQPDPGDSPQGEWEALNAELQKQPELKLVFAFSAALEARTGSFGENVTLEEGWQRDAELGRLTEYVTKIVDRLNFSESPLGQIDVAVSYVKKVGDDYFWGLAFRTSAGDWVLPSSLAMDQEHLRQADYDLCLEKCAAPTLMVFQCKSGCEPGFGFVIVDDKSSSSLAKNANDQSAKIGSDAHLNEFTPEAIDLRHSSFVAEIVRQQLIEVLKSLRGPREVGRPLIQSLQLEELSDGIFDVRVTVKNRLQQGACPDYISDQFHLLLCVNPNTRSFASANTREPDPLAAEFAGS